MVQLNQALKDNRIFKKKENFITPLNQWNYFIAIEKDIENISRYIEFSESNYSTHSIELTHVLLSVSSEIDVVLKQLCKIVDPEKTPGNLEDYYKIIKEISGFKDHSVNVERFGLTFYPFKEWTRRNPPSWWKSYNNVKHHRDKFYKDANLKNTLESVSGLLVALIYFYKLSFAKEKGEEIDLKTTTFNLQPFSTLFKIEPEHYCEPFFFSY